MLYADASYMTPIRQLKAVRLDEDLVKAMAELRDRDGILESEQIRRALRPFLEAKGVLPPKPKRAPVRSARSGKDE